jgi:hypothetical protein
VPLCLPQIPHGLNRDRTRVSAVKGWRLVAWAMAKRTHTHTHTHTHEQSSLVRCATHLICPNLTLLRNKSTPSAASLFSCRLINEIITIRRHWGRRQTTV